MRANPGDLVAEEESTRQRVRVDALRALLEEDTEVNTVRMSGIASPRAVVCIVFLTPLRGCRSPLKTRTFSVSLVPMWVPYIRSAVNVSNQQRHAVILNGIIAIRSSSTGCRRPAVSQRILKRLFT